MPYTYSATARRSVHAGRSHHEVTVVELGVTGNTDEWHFDLTTLALPAPRLGRVTFVSSTTTGGSATTIDPQASGASGGTLKEVYENGTAAASVRFQPADGRYLGPTLYGQSKANGTATSITTVLVIAEGHQ